MKETFYKEKIGFYKLILTIAATGFYGVMGWWFINFDDAVLRKLFLNIVGIVIMCGIIVLAIHKIQVYGKKIKELH